MPQDDRPTAPLPSVECPKCRATLNPRTAKVVAAFSFGSCLRPCDVCGIGFSNAQTHPVMIVAAPEQAVPDAVIDELTNALEGSVNEVNRKNKCAKFCFETSEDAITWTVFRRLQMRERLRAGLHAAGVVNQADGV